MLACEDGCLRYLTRHPREGDIPLYSTSPDAAARIAELEAERDRLREALQAVLDFVEGKPDALEPFGLVRATLQKEQT